MGHVCKLWAVTRKDWNESGMRDDAPTVIYTTARNSSETSRKGSWQ